MNDIKRIFIIVVTALLFTMSIQIPLFASNGIINNDTIGKIKAFKNEINFIANVIIAFAAVTSVLIFIVHFIRLANSYDHPITRKKIINDIYVTAICTALIGAVGLISKIFIGVYL